MYKLNGKLLIQFNDMFCMLSIHILMQVDNIAISLHESFSNYF